jgi:hypothetical protein
MYVVIRSNPDGDSYYITSSLDNARASFERERKIVEDSIIDSGECVALLSVKEDEDFGRGAWGDWYGCEVIEEFGEIPDDEE